ncbi:MAG: polyprenyl synthetase family protein [Candidatus Paceibacterota bacterium]|jgi:geranylgeranyl diphosphate synthase type I
MTENKFESNLIKWANLVDPKIKEILNISVDKKTQNLLDYQISTGGKRLRPALAIVTCLACGGKIKDVLYSAAGLEILHNCTLIYDDIIDGSDLRRGQPTVWAKYGKSITECLGLDYAAAIFQATNKSRYPVAVSEILAQTLKKIMDGQILDMLFEQSGRKDEKYINENRFKKITEKDYLKMIGLKTASLTQACCEIGALIANAKKDSLKNIKHYGFNLGVAFQIKDDILDVFGKEKEFGKKIGKDIQDKKIGNIVILYALEELGTKKNNLLNILKKNRILDSDIKKALKIIGQTKARERALVLEKNYVKRTKASLEKLPPSRWRKLLTEMIYYVIERNK